MEKKRIEIHCSACKADSLLRREPLYEGFRKVGDRLLCASCGHEYPNEDAVPFRERKAAGIFTEADRVRRPVVFNESDREKRNCRHCANYVVNPFVARCSLHNKFVQATDTCGKFEAKEAEGEGEK